MEAADGGHLGAAYFHATNRGKRSIELDFESEDGRRIVRKLAARSDVLMENFKVGGLAKFGLDYASLCKDNPRLIYCSVTGFGQDGPYAPRAGYDLMAQGMGGFMDLTGAADGEPTRAGVPGLRYFHRRLFGGRHPRRAGANARRPAAAASSIPRWSTPPSACSPTRRSIISSPARSPAHRQCASQYRPLSGVPGRRRPHHHRHRQRQPVRQALQRARRARLSPRPRLPDNSAGSPPRALIERLSALTSTFQSGDLLAKLEAVGVPAGPINTLDQVFADPQVVHRGMRLDLPTAAAKAGSIPGVRTPIVIDGAPMAAERPAPRLGEHTAEILKEIGEV